MTNTVAYSVGRVCYPTQRDALVAIHVGRRRALTRDQWWPGKATRQTTGNANLFEAFLAIFTAPDTQRDYMAVEGPR